MQRDGVGRLIDREAESGQQEEPARRAQHRNAVATEGEVVVTREGNAECRQPACHVGDQRPQACVLDQSNHHEPVDRRCSATDGNEAKWARELMQHGAHPNGKGGLRVATGLCVCADDYGLDPGVNAAVASLAELGRLHATGALVGGGAWRQGQGWLRDCANALDVGLHLDFTEAPLTPGARFDLGNLILQCYVGSVNVAMVRAEVRAQLDAFEDALGRVPAFVDGHQHVHQLPVVREVLLDELVSRYPTGPRPWLRDTRSRLRSLLGAGLRDAGKAAVIASLGAGALAALARQRGFLQNRGFLGVYGFTGGAPRYARLLQQWLAAARPGDLLMCHPGLNSRDALASSRSAEFAVLTSPVLTDWLDAGGLRLAPMGLLLVDA